MNWSKFNTHGESEAKAFESMCNMIFEKWCRKEYKDSLTHFCFVNGSGGDGGVEAYAVVDDNKIIAVQSKWFREVIKEAQIKQIKDSFETAMKVRPQITKYIICIPRDLGSKRVGSGRKITENTEESRWEKFLDDSKKQYPNVEIELWNETRIFEKFTDEELHNMYKFWFEDRLVLDSSFNYSYKKAINSWAKTKYIPDVYTEGIIHDELEFYLGSRSITKKRYEGICTFIEKIKDLKKAYEDFLNLGIPEKENELKNKIVDDITTLDKWYEYLLGKKEHVKNGFNILFEENFRLICSVEDIKDSGLHFGKYFHCRDIEKILEHIKDDYFELKHIFDLNTSNKRIIMGDPGCGKTTAIVSEISGFLEKSSHLPILIQAKEIDDNETWSNIVAKNLGLSQDVGEKDLFCALDNSAFLRNHDDEYGINCKCVICVDGIDESSNWNYWIDKIDEVKVLEDLYPRIKFVFLSRPYVFNNNYIMENSDDFIRILCQGDVNAKSICEKYFDKYNIDIGDNKWIKECLRTPLSVKLFCDIYKNKNIENIEKNTIVITELFKRKINNLQEEFMKKKGIKYGNYSIYNILCELALLFAEKGELSKNDLELRLSNYDKLPMLLEFLKEEGFIYTFYRNESDFEPQKCYFSWGMQPAFDYLIARKLYDRIKSGEIIQKDFSEGIYQMLALILIEERGELISDFSNISVPDRYKEDLFYYIMRNASSETVQNYREYVLKIMDKSVEHFRSMINEVIIPVCIIKNHPLGARLLDEKLRMFEQPAIRDVWWSVPAYLSIDEDDWWVTYTDIKWSMLNVDNDDSYETTPLFLSWSLSSVDNDVCETSRIKLIQWGINNSEEFFKLFVYMSDINDEQVIEDMFSILYGIALNQFVKKVYLLKVPEWIVDKVFSQDGLSKYENSAIRYYSFGILKIAAYYGVIENQYIETASPQYKYDTKILDIEPTLLNASRMGGYQTLTYDLVRYVLCDHLDEFLRKDYKTNQYRKSTLDFLKKYKDKYSLTEINTDGLIISMAYKYLENQGWNSLLFYYDDNKEGIDLAIVHRYPAATHGSKSRMMNISEKYTWVFRHKIEAVLANEVKIYEDYTNGNAKYIEGYYKLDYFVNSHQDYINNLNIDNEEKWINIELLAISDDKGMNKENIINWMKDNKLPDFEKWIFNNDKIILYTFTKVENTIAGIEELIWVSSGAVKKERFELFVEGINNYFENREEMISVNGFTCNQDCYVYCSPQEACIVYPDNEENSIITEMYNDEKIEIYKCLSSCMVSDDNKIENTFTLPSRFLRETTGIIYGDGYNYCDSNMENIVRYYSNGEYLESRQDILLINQEIFTDSLDRQQYKPFWLIRNYKNPTNKAYEAYGGIMQDVDKTYLVWLEDKEIKYKLLDEVKPIVTENDTTNELIESITKMVDEYGD